MVDEVVAFELPPDFRCLDDVDAIDEDDDDDDAFTIVEVV